MHHSQSASLQPIARPEQQLATVATIIWQHTVAVSVASVLELSYIRHNHVIA